jgi:hypothetical protein
VQRHQALTAACLLKLLGSAQGKFSWQCAHNALYCTSNCKQCCAVAAAVGPSPRLCVYHKPALLRLLCAASLLVCGDSDNTWYLPCFAVCVQRPCLCLVTLTRAAPWLTRKTWPHPSQGWWDCWDRHNTTWTMSW